jgi:hypothetical protein
MFGIYVCFKKNEVEVVHILAQGRIFVYWKGGVEKFLVGCKRHHSVSVFKPP